MLRVVNAAMHWRAAQLRTQVDEGQRGTRQRILYHRKHAYDYVDLTGAIPQPPTPIAMRPARG
jgi:hypothetical protein